MQFPDRDYNLKDYLKDGIIQILVPCPECGHGQRKPLNPHPGGGTGMKFCRLCYTQDPGRGKLEATITLEELRKLLQ